jgi:hypothetical protein
MSIPATDCDVSEEESREFFDVADDNQAFYLCWRSIVMNTRKFWITEPLASIFRQFGTALGCTLFIALASGCATHPLPGFPEYNQLTPVVQCRGGTIKFCARGSGRLRRLNKQDSHCSCINPDEFDPDVLR